MPTGFTEPLIEGKIKTFKEFAITCARAFGFASHLRDEDMDMPFKFKEASPYYLKRLDRLKERVKDLKTKTNEQLFKEERKEVESDIKWYKKAIINNKKTREVFANIEKDILAWDKERNFPEIKSFMLQQLHTEDFDRHDKYYKEELEKYQNKKIDMQDMHKLREERLKKLEEEITETKGELNKEIEQIKESNDFAIKFFNSLK